MKSNNSTVFVFIDFDVLDAAIIFEEGSKFFSMIHHLSYVFNENAIFSLSLRPMREIRDRESIFLGWLWWRCCLDVSILFGRRRGHK